MGYSPRLSKSTDARQLIPASGQVRRAAGGINAVRHRQGIGKDLVATRHTVIFFVNKQDWLIFPTGSF